MNELLLTNKSFLINYLRSNNIMLKKKYGQNFVIDNNLIQLLINSAQLSKEDTVLEIGAGIGSLTEALIKTGAKVISVEKDPAFAKLLRHHFGNYPNFNLIENDILNKAVFDLIKENLSSKNKIVSNLPYYITTPIITKFLQSGIRFENIILTIQKEVADRIVSKKGTKQYSSLSIFVKYYADSFIEGYFPPASFFPSPQVYSAVLKLVPYADPPYKSTDPVFFHNFVKLCFTERRKMLKNSIFRMLKTAKAELTMDKIEEILESLNISKELRPEVLPIEDFIKISERIINIKNGG